MALIDTIAALAGGGALAEALRYLRARASTQAATVAATERAGRHAVADRAAHVEQLLHRVERIEAQRDESLSEIADLRVACARTEGELSVLRVAQARAEAEIAALRHELEDTREELAAAVARALAAEEAREELRAEVEELRSRPLSNPPVASGD